MKRVSSLVFSFALLAGTASTVSAQEPLFASMTNAANNALVLYNAKGKLVASLPTGGNGGCGGNGGAVQVQEEIIAVPDCGSKDVAIFFRDVFGSVDRKPSIKTASAPASVTLGHLYIQEADRVESFRISVSFGFYLGAAFDGSVMETKADGSAGQIGYVADGHVIYTEKSGAVSEIALSTSGAVTGTSVLVSGLPASLNTPLGLSCSDKLCVVTSAHDSMNQQMLVIGGKIVSLANGTGVFSSDADCWNAFYGQFVYSSDSPHNKVDRFLATDAPHLWFDKTVANLPGAPTDLAISDDGLLGVIWPGGLVIYQIDDEGELTQLGSASMANPNGAAWID